MKLTPEACRAGRALLDWSMRDLASAAQVSVTTVLKIEQGSESTRSETFQKIQAAFAARGVDLIVQRAKSGAILNRAQRAAGGSNGGA